MEYMEGDRQEHTISRMRWSTYSSEQFIFDLEHASRITEVHYNCAWHQVIR